MNETVVKRIGAVFASIAIVNSLLALFKKYSVPGLSVACLSLAMLIMNYFRYEDEFKSKNFKLGAVSLMLLFSGFLVLGLLELFGLL